MAGSSSATGWMFARSASGGSVGHLRKWLVRILNSLHKLRNASRPFGSHDPEFSQMAAQGIDDLGSLLHEKIARPEHESGGLRLLALGNHKAHGRALGRLADCFGIRRIVLLPLDERPHVSRRDQADITRPVLS